MAIDPFFDFYSSTKTVPSVTIKGVPTTQTVKSGVLYNAMVSVGNPFYPANMSTPTGFGYASPPTPVGSGNTKALQMALPLAGGLIRGSGIIMSSISKMDAGISTIASVIKPQPILNLLKTNIPYAAGGIASVGIGAQMAGVGSDISLPEVAGVATASLVNPLGGLVVGGAIVAKKATEQGKELKSAITEKAADAQTRVTDIYKQAATEIKTTVSSQSGASNPYASLSDTSLMSKLTDTVKYTLPPVTNESTMDKIIAFGKEQVDRVTTFIEENPKTTAGLIAGTIAGGLLLANKDRIKKALTPKKKKTVKKPSKPKSKTVKKPSKPKSKIKKPKKPTGKPKTKKLKFGTPAWRKKYLKKRGTVSSRNRKKIPRSSVFHPGKRLDVGSSAQYSKKGGSKVRYTKKGQPFIIDKATGRARFIEKPSKR